MKNIASYPLNQITIRVLISALFVLPMILITNATHGDTYSAKRAGQGFTGITQDVTSALSNPALLTKFDSTDDIFFSFNLGILSSDQYDVIYTIEDISDGLDQLVSDLDHIQNQDFTTIGEAKKYYDTLYEQADLIVADFEKIDKKIIKANEGVNFQILIPNNYFSLGLFTNQYGRVGGLVNYNPQDENTINNAITNCIPPIGNDPCELDLNELQSSTLAAGYSIAEVGIIAAFPLVKQSDFDISLGAKLKYQRIDVYFNNATVSDLDDEDFELTDDDNLTDKSGTNIDIGMYTVWGTDRQWAIAIVTNNLMGQTVHHKEQDVTFTLDSNAILGFSYQNSWLTLSTEVDLTDRISFAALAPSKYLGVGVEFCFYEQMKLRAGYRTDLNEVDANLFTAGIGISPWDAFIVDIAAFTGDNDTVGGAFQLSFKI